MNKILILSEGPSDLAELILQNCPDSAFFTVSDDNISFEKFDACCVIGGNGDTPWILPARVRCQVEKMREEKKPVFAEFSGSVGGCYMDTPESMSHHRMAYLESNMGIHNKGLTAGDILDGHYNDCINFVFIPQDAVPVLVYHPYLCAHDHVDMTEEKLKKGIWALFYMDEHTLVSGMRLCNFRKARLAPQKSWEVILTGILSFLAGEQMKLSFPAPVCTFLRNTKVTCAADTRAAVARGLAWYKNADMLVDNGKNGVLEGLSHHIYAKNGVQMRADQIRTDCTAETGGAFMMDALVRKDAYSMEIYENTGDFCFECMQVKEGLHSGMLRWSQSAWQTCYQDDNARVLLPSLLKANYGGGTRYLKEIFNALDYLVKTTGKNGLRRMRTDIPTLDEEMMRKLREEDCDMTSAHYNAFYHAVLLLAYRAGGPAVYLEVAQKGLAAIMSCYPDNIRETSETEENCRLILPLSVLYQVTGKEEHKAWLYRVTGELLKVRHESGAYCEWDTEYRANCSRREAGECALLAQNGDPVADLLYSVNWLPLGFAYAYLVTKDKLFYQLWCDIASFFVSCQIHSEDKTLDGAWTRAFDLERWEIYGVPHDVGWAPCCVESGWTVGEILIGLQFMHIVEKMV